MTETEWLSIEKISLESLPHAQNENSSSLVQGKWGQLHRKIEDLIDRMKEEE